MSDRHFANWKNISVWTLLVLAQLWYWSRLFTSGGVFAHSDLYEYFLPAFRSPFMTWSSAEFGGLPVFADPQNATWYPLQLLFGRAIGSWSGYIVSAYVVAGVGAGAYAWQLTRSRAAVMVAGLAWPWSEALAGLYPHLAFLHGFAWLPWVLLGIEKILEEPRASWVAVTGVWFACLVLSGHPQAAVYCSYLLVAYVVVGWLVSSRSPTTLACLFAPFALGGLMTAVQVLPTLAASSWVARTQVSFNQFAMAFAKEPYELMSVVVPQFCHDHREKQSYIGVLTLALAAVGIMSGARQWRVRFWMGVAVICLLLGLGASTPLAGLAYDVPFYDKFRVVSRHLVLFSFAVIVLGAMGAGAICSGRLSARRTVSTAAVVTLLSLGALMFLRARPDLYDASCGGTAFNRLTEDVVSAPSVQGGLIALAGVLVALSAMPAWRPVVLAVIPIVLAADLLNAADQPVDLRGYQPPSLLDARLLEPSVHAARLRDELLPAHQRLVPLEGSATDPLVPGVFARLWNIPSLGGYNPLLPGRLARLTRMGGNGATPPSLLFSDDATLDLLAVRYVSVRADDIRPAVAAPADAGVSAIRSLDMLIGPSDCRDRGPMRATFVVPPVDISAVIVLSRLTCGDNIHDATPVGTLIVRGDDREDSFPMEAGLPDASSAGTVIRVPGLGREHGTPGLATYQIPLPAVTRARVITIEAAAMRSAMQVDGLGVVAADGRIVPLTLPAAALDLTTRWREHTRFRTSRDTDRGTDETKSGEAEYVVLENLRARPRAWFAGTVVNVDEDAALDSIRFSRLRDGTILDVASTAFVSPGTRVSAGGGTGQVTMDAITPGRFELSVEATSPGLVMLAELHHPDWRAWVDGQPANVERADFAVMGIPVPSGRHHVVVSFQPRSLQLGAVVSIAGCLIAIACVAGPMRRWRGSRGR